MARGVQSVSVNPRTGRALLVVDASAHELPQEVRAILASLGGLPPPSARRIARTAARAVRDALHTAKRLRRGAERPEPPPPWHARSAGEVLDAFGSSERGLTDAEAERRRIEHGHNLLGGIQVRTRAQILAGQVLTVPTALLGGAMALSLALGDVLEAAAILAVLGSNVAVGYVTESRAEELLNAWRELPAEWARVVRDGREREVRAAEIVPGDVLVLRAGEPIPADARVIEAEGLTVDESMLTGESEPVDKLPAPVPESTPFADRSDVVHTGTIVASGHGRAVVVATGAATALASLRRGLSGAEQRRGPLEEQLDELGKRVAIGSVASSVAVVALGLLRGRSPAVLARDAVALAVAAIPEGFPAAGTTALALASRRLRREGIVIRRLSAAETLGAVSVICADKTGTLTENRMRVEELFVPGVGALAVRWPGGPDARPVELMPKAGGGSFDPARLHDLARIAALNADVDIDERGVVRQGSGTERALVELAVALGYPVPERRQAARRIREQRRTPSRAFMVTVHAHPELGEIELVKGAPEQVIALCPVDEPARRELEAANYEMASTGLRVLALAWSKNGSADQHVPLHLAGLVGLRDPARPGVRAALERLERSGVQTHVLTGDQERTALAIGALLGVPAEAIHARITPDQKLDLVHELQRSGHIVAMIGDGMNDGPALSAASVGVAMGRRGTDVARAVADVVLADDQLPALVRAVAEGRRLYDNVRRAIGYLLSTNASEVALVLAGGVLGVRVLGPLQLLWLNVLTDVLPALALAVEPADEGILHRPPRDPKHPIFSRDEVRRIAREAALLASSAALAYVAGDPWPNAARTRAFTALVTGQLLHARAWRAHTHRRNRDLERVIAGSLLAQIAALQSRGLSRVLDTQRIVGSEVALSLALGAASEIVRSFRRIRARIDEGVVRVARAPASPREESCHEATSVVVPARAR